MRCADWDSRTQGMSLRSPTPPSDTSIHRPERPPLARRLPANAAQSGGGDFHGAIGDVFASLVTFLPSAPNSERDRRARGGLGLSPLSNSR